MLIDLHAHSTASDGLDSPAALVRLAASAGIDVLALTDHDTDAGWAEAAAALPPGMSLVRGIELSAYVDEPRADDRSGTRRISVHLLAYLLDPGSTRIAESLAGIRESRRDRGRRMAERLVSAGFPISWQDVSERAGDATVGRPHLADALVRAGVVPSRDVAFQDLLGQGSPYYVPRAGIEARDAIRMVRASGGVPVLAHPRARRRGATVSDETIADLAVAGLVGIERDHPDHSPAERAETSRLAAAYGLVTTGSSDFHGSATGRRLGQETTSPEVYEMLLAAASGPVSVIAG